MTLPIYIVERSRARAYVRVTCPRCRNAFWVHYAKWVSGSKYTSRPCPFCFKTSLIKPEED